MSDSLFDATAAPVVISLQRQLQAVRREIRLRQQAYPRLIAVHRMSPKRANEELAAMRAVEQTLLELIEGQEP
jgi:hypothetical protein